ncbi:transposase [Kangiella sp. TOML190]|uniref:REP-associated tyrosine transposase n=1 Tax=Kangiella sp. TOML190 TaxID=2931351 RepID=UPI00203C5EC0|nr:transposase [Kangiella sp. TOML190]
MQYRRAYVDGGTYFFTINLYNRKQTLLTDHVDLLRESFRYVKSRHPFTIDAIVVLPDHLHLIMTLPADDDFSTRIGLIKQHFTRHLNQLNPNSSKPVVWQKRFWEHLIRDPQDFENHVNYIHYNPVRHGYCQRAADWQYSSIHRFIKQGVISHDWAWQDDTKIVFGE